jgi:hypothetical protein
MSEWDARFAQYPTFAAGKIPIEWVRCSIRGVGRVEILKSPHYSHLFSNGSSKAYVNYLREHFPELNCSEQVARFEELFRSLQEEPIGVSVLARQISPFSRKVLVVDGTHRAAIAAHIGLKKLNLCLTY